MDWIQGIQRAIDYVEENMTEEIDFEEVARQAYSSSFHFQRIFRILCGFSLGDYIRMRRLSLAGEELSKGNGKIIDMAMKYGYDTPESFTRAFTRFHGITPSEAKHSGNARIFTPLSVKLTLTGGSKMDYRIEKREAFQVVCKRKSVGKPQSANATSDITAMWQEFGADGTMGRLIACIPENPVMKGLENKKADHEDLMIVINVFPRMQKLGFQFDEKEVLENYYNNVQWAEEIVEITYLDETWCEAYHQFMEKHQKEIKEHFFENRLDDIFKMEYYDENMVRRILDMAEEWCHQLGVEYTEEDENFLYEEAGYEPPKKQKKPKKIKESEMWKKQEEEEKNYEEINREAKKWFDPEETYLTSKQIKEMERNRGRDYRKGYLTRGKFTEHNFNIVLEFLEQAPCIPKKEYEFYKELTSYLLKDDDKAIKEQLGKLALELILSGNDRFSKTEAEKYLGMEDAAGFIDICINRDIIYKNGKWYCYWNSAYMYSLALEVWCTKNREKEDVSDILERFMPEDMTDNWGIFFYENEKTTFMKHIAVPIFAKFLQEIQQMDQKGQEEWLVEKLEFSAKIEKKKSGITMFCTVVNALFIFEMIEEDVFFGLYDSVDDLFENHYESLMPYIEADGTVKLKTLLQEKRWIRRFEKVGGYEAAEQILEQMKNMIQCYGN